MTNDPTKQFQERYGKAIAEAEHDYIENARVHSQLVDLRHELAELRGLQRSASCQRGWLVAAIALLFAGLVALGWVMS